MSDPIYAGFWRRALAASLDNLTWLFGVCSFSAPCRSTPITSRAPLRGSAFWWSSRSGSTTSPSASGAGDRRSARTPSGSRCARWMEPSGSPSARRASRNLLRLIDFFVIGEVMIVADGRRQRLGDKAAKTVVVRRAPRAERAAPFPSTQTAAIAGAAESADPAVPRPPVPGVRRAAPSREAAGGAQDARGHLGARGLDLGPDRGPAPGGDRAAASRPARSTRTSAIRTRPATPASWPRQAIFDVFLMAVAIGMASGWHFNLRQALGRLGVRTVPALRDRLDVRRARHLLRRGDRLLGDRDPAQAGGHRQGARRLQPRDRDCDRGHPGGRGARHPVAEELFFRGFFFAGLYSRWSLWPSALLSGAIFGLVHAPTGPTAAIPLAGLGVGLAWLYNKTGSIWPCMLAHFLNNAIAISVVVGQC